MSKKTAQSRVTYGGWYQRTTIHLTEVYDFLSECKTSLPLDENKLKSLYANLRIKEVTREAAYLEYVKMITTDGIQVRYYEDGLYIVEITDEDFQRGGKKIKKYFHERFNPAIKYIFSLGAQIPKELANIKEIHPTVIGVVKNKHKSFEIDTKKYGKIYSQISSKDITVYKTPEYIFVVAAEAKKKVIVDLIEMQMFFREFKDQLEKYLEIHRLLWEKISRIKNRKQLKGDKISKVRYELDSYDKTVTLISSRMNQMGSYVSTRAQISQNLKIEKHLNRLFQYKFEVLTNTLDYIKDIWDMTREYLNSAIKIIVEMESKVTETSIKSLRFITTLIVMARIMGYLQEETLPTFTLNGLGNFLILILLTWFVDKIIVGVSKQVRYKLQFSKKKKFK